MGARYIKIKSSKLDIRMVNAEIYADQLLSLYDGNLKIKILNLNPPWVEYKK